MRPKQREIEEDTEIDSDHKKVNNEMNKKVNDEMNNNVDQELDGDKHCGIAIALIEDGDGARYEGVVVTVINMIGDAAMVGQVRNVKILENLNLLGNLHKMKLNCKHSRATASDYFF